MSQTSNSDLSSQGGFLFGGSAQALKAADLEAMKTAIDDEEAESQNVETEAGGNADAEEAPETSLPKETENSENNNSLEDEVECSSYQNGTSHEPEPDKEGTSQDVEEDIVSSQQDSSETAAEEEPEQTVKRTPRGRRNAKEQQEETMELDEAVKKSTRPSRKNQEQPIEIDGEDELKNELTVLKSHGTESSQQDSSETAAEEEPEQTVKRTPRGKRNDKEQQEETMEVDEVVKRSTRSSRKTQEQPIENDEEKELEKTVKRTPRGKRNAKEQQEETMEVDEVVKRSTRSSRKTQEQRIDINEEEPQNEAPKTPVRTNRKRAAASSEQSKSFKKSKEDANKTVATDDPYSFETQANNHPEPLFSVSKGGFNNIKFTLSPRVNRIGESKYLKTELAAARKRNAMGTENVQSLDPITPLSITELSTSTASGKAALKSVTPRSETKRGRAAKKDTPIKTQTPKSSQRGARKASISPVLPRKDFPEVTAPVVAAEDQKNLDFSQEPYPTGMRVYALWGRELYPAIVCDRDGLGRYKVFFVEDSLHRDIPPTGIVCLALLKEGTEVSTTAIEEGDEIEKVVKIVTIPDTESASEWVKADFEVSADEDKITVPWNKIFLTMAQQKNIRVPKNTAVDVGVDNVLSTRSRRGRVSAVPSNIEPIVHTPKKRGELESSNLPKKTPSPKKVPSPKKTPLKHSGKEKSVEPEENPVEKTSDKIFEGKHFMLTSSARRGPQSGFNKREFKSMIESRGGVVSEEIYEGNDASGTFLVADTYYRTHKYLFALAADIPCVHYNWIEKCVESNKFVPHEQFLLPAGISVLDDKEYKCKPLKGKLFKDKTLFVYSATPSSADVPITPFCDIWRPLLVTLGARVISTPATDPNEVMKFINENEFDFILTDRSCDSNVIKQSNINDRPVVSSNWVIHGIVTSELPSVETHESFLPTN